MPESVISMVEVLKNKYLPFLFAVPLFFSVYHYSGIVVDAILYVTQYVYSIDPERFLGDPAFEFGNQDSLGFFSPIFGLFLETMGVAKGAFVYTLLMQFAWVVCAVFMIKQLLQLVGQRLWILPVTILFFVIFANGMGFSHIRWFQYVPLYACSRSLSVVLGIGALSLIFAQKRTLSLVLILAGTTVHPITAGWCLPFWMFYFFPKTRTPILLVSIVFPLTFIIHKGALDLFPKDWLARPLSFAPDYEVLSRYILLLVFEWALFRKSVNVQVRKIAKSLILLTVVAFYWDVWSGYGEHIFLYQVQPWRAVWLPSLVAAPLGVCFVKDVTLKVIKRKAITSHDFAMLLLVVSFLATRNIFVISFVAVVVLLKREAEMPLRMVALFSSGLIFGGYLVQQYHTWCLQGFKAFLGYDYQDAYHLRDSFLVYQLVFAVGYIVFFLNQKKFVLAVLVASFVFLSRFMLLPLLPLYLYFFPKESRVKYWGGAALIIVLVLFDGLLDVETRRMTLWGALPLCFLWVCVATVASLVAIYLSKRFSYIGIAIWLSVCSVIATANYYTDFMSRLEIERPLDQYLHHPIFSQVAERGRMLFFVSGAFISEPRLQFMTGSYFTSSIDIGSIFNKDHYRVALERSHLLYQKDRALQSDKFYDYVEIVSKLADADTLIDRVSFLCGMNEITHLVTDKVGLPFVVEDSTLVNGGQKTYLYGCNPAR